MGTRPVRGSLAPLPVVPIRIVGGSRCGNRTASLTTLSVALTNNTNALTLPERLWRASVGRDAIVVPHHNYQLNSLAKYMAGTKGLACTLSARPVPGGIDGD